MQLFDQTGRLVQTIIPTQKRSTGQHTFSLLNDQGLQGMYFVLLQTENEKVVQKVMVLTH